MTAKETPQKPTPHLDKLRATLNNDKLPSSDRPRVEAALEQYSAWIEELTGAGGGPGELIRTRVDALTRYKRYIDLDLTFDSDEDFLYRQKGQLKIDNSIIEEFLPWLATTDIIPELAEDIVLGPTSCFSAVYFDSTLAKRVHGAGVHARSKDQDFALSRRLYLRASHNADFSEAAQEETFVAYVATEIKTNLDKTMFQEACATARDVRSAVPAARYFLMCEWLDMTPISTAPTDIERVFLLRGAKRMGSNHRRHFGNASGRKKHRDSYIKFLDSAPFRADVFARWVDDIRGLFQNDVPVEEDVLRDGVF